MTCNIARNDVMLQAFDILYPRFICFRTLLRLSSTARIFRSVRSQALLYLAYRNCNVRWRSVGVPACGFRQLPLEHSRWLTMLEATRLDSNRIFYKGTGYFIASAPSPAQALKQLSTMLCRECFRPTRARALTGRGSFVLVCRTCSKDTESYSCLIDRKEAIQQAKLLFGSGIVVAAVLRKLKTLTLARRGGNRSMLYWKHEVRAALLSLRIATHYQSRIANAVAK